MHWSIYSILSIVLLCIFLQDLRSISVAWMLFPAIAATGILNNFLQAASWLQLLTNIAFNLLFIGLQFGLLALFFLFRKKKLSNQIGSGDILFLLTCSFHFSPMTFIFFNFLSLLFTLVAHFTAICISKKQQQFHSIALAGWQSVFLILFIGSCSYAAVPFTNDNWIITQLLTI